MPRTETGIGAVSPPDEAAIKEIVKRDLGPEIFCFCRWMVGRCKTGHGVWGKGIVIEIPVSAQPIEKAYKWPLEKWLENRMKNSTGR